MLLKDVYSIQFTWYFFIPNMTSIALKAKELFSHGNQVTIAARYVVMPIILKRLHTKYDLNRTQDKRVIYITLWLPW